MKRHIRSWCMGLVVLMVPVCIFAEESITITTYYPSPQGSYKTLRAKRMAIGDNYYQDEKWPDQGGTIGTNADLIVEGRVGIGTTNPGSPLSISSNTTGIYALELNRTNTDTAYYNTWRMWNMNASYGYGLELWQYPLVPASYGGLTSIRRLKIEPDGNTLLCPTGGNVGIGTVSPQAKLDVNGTMIVNGSMYAPNANWTNVTAFSGTWANYGGSFQKVQYKRVGDLVFLRGRATCTSASQPIFTLPVGFRPSADEMFVQRGAVVQARVTDGTYLTPILIYSSNGTVSAYEADRAGWTYFDGIFFSVD